MKNIGITTFGSLFLTFMLTFSHLSTHAQSSTTITAEEQELIDSHVKITRQEYIHKWCNQAIENREMYGIPASITLGQAILESGYGNGSLAILTNNHFGIKCKSEWTGATRIWRDDLPDDCFRVYESIEESYIDHAEFLSSRPWYDPLFAYEITDYKSWAKGLKEAGYATDPQYAEKLIGVIEETFIYLLDEEDGLQRYNDHLAATYGIDPITINKISEDAEKGAEQGATKATTASESLHDRMTKAYADNGIDPNSYRITINSHYGYSVYFTNGTHYIVAKSGDTYASIAKLFEISETMLRRYNDVDGKQVLRSGDLVYVERKSARWQGGDLLHKVTEGETLHMLSQIYGIRLNQLSKMNRIRPNDPLNVGQTVRLR